VPLFVEPRGRIMAEPRTAESLAGA